MPPRDLCGGCIESCKCGIRATLGAGPGNRQWPIKLGRGKGMVRASICSEAK